MLKIRKFWEILFGLKYFFHAKLKFNFHIPLTVWFLLRNEKTESNSGLERNSFYSLSIFHWSNNENFDLTAYNHVRVDHKSNTKKGVHGIIGVHRLPPKFGSLLDIKAPGPHLIYLVGLPAISDPHINICRTP